MRAAQKAQAGWGDMTGTERARVLRRAGDLLRSRNQELAELETRDTGKPIQETRVVDVASGADCFEYFAGLAQSLAGEQIGVGQVAHQLAHDAESLVGVVGPGEDDGQPGDNLVVRAGRYAVHNLTEVVPSGLRGGAVCQQVKPNLQPS